MPSRSARSLPPLALVFVVLGLCFSPESALGETLFVNEDGVSPYTSLQAAVDAASEGDVILVFPGTYDPVTISGLGVTLRSTGGPDLTIIDASGPGGPAVTLEDFVPSEMLLHGFTLQGGTGAYAESVALTAGGGLLVNRYSSPRISGNVIVGNSAEVGGGIAILDSAPDVYGNLVASNTASSSGGGLWLQNGVTSDPVDLVCNEFLGNSGGSVGGIFVGEANLVLTNSTLVGNSGERGGLWLGLASSGAVDNNTFVSNEGDSFSAAGLESESDGVDFSGNLVAWNLGGWGVIRNSLVADWSYNDLWGNSAGNYAGAAGDPTGVDGNLEQEPLFVYFTPADPLDDILSLAAGSSLLDLGDPAVEQADLDGSRNAIGFEGGPHLGCDLDGDGVRPDEGDCRPSEGEFFPGAYELEGGLDTDCDGYGLLGLYEFVLDDGGLVSGGSGYWEFADPVDLPGIGYQGLAAWCTVCNGEVPAGATPDLQLDLDLSSIPAGTAAQLEIVHAWDLAGSGGTASLQAQVPLGGPWVEQASWSGSSTGGWVTEAVDITDLTGSLASVRFQLLGLGTDAPGWSIGRIEVGVVDGDGDGRAASLMDCDDADDSVYIGAPETPYDGVDQDCDGLDLLDFDGDGSDGIGGGGDDCDDTDPEVYPGALEIGFDGIDQDCDGSDLLDGDGDGYDSAAWGGDDCDDGDADVHPGAEEIPYDGIDQDCSGLDLVDVDGDGAIGDQPPPFGDCDDEDPEVYPGAEEICGDGIDNDCDEAVDVLPDLDGDGFDACSGDCDDSRPEVVPGAEEVCDGHDTDCDGVLLEGELDEDGDGVLICAGDCDDGHPDIAASLPEVCDGLDNDCDGGIDEGHDEDGDGFSACTRDCDDLRSAVYPGAALVCDAALDHDCDGVPDFEQEECTGAAGCVLGGARPSGGLLWLVGLVLGVLVGAQRSRRIQAAPASGLPGSTSPACSLSEGRQAR